MKIMHVTESRSWSGGTVQLYRLMEAMRAQGHQAALFCPPDGELQKRVDAKAVAVTRWPMRQDYDVVAAKKLAQAVRDFAPDIVHAHHPRAHALALLAGFLTPIPHLIVSRRVSFPLKKWNVFSLLKYRNSRIQAFFAVSSEVKNVLVDAGVKPEKIEVVYSGVDTEQFSPQPRDEKLATALGLPAGTPVIGNLTHFSWWKGQTFFLEAAQQVIASGGRAHFLLVGKDTDGPEARAKVKELGIEKHVTLAGFRTDMPEVLSLLIISVVSSLAGEGFSGVIRDSMSMGVPVIATDVGGNKELVSDGQTGLLVRKGDAEALAGAMKKFLAEPALAKACAAAAQSNVRVHYSIDSMVRRSIALYQEALKN
jgi:glycosyltransferase involved in cell wall biosynthesis